VLEGNFLRISNYLKEIRVPISQVSRGGVDPEVSVGTSVSVGPVAAVERTPLIGIQFRDDTPFGRVVEFIPKSPESVDQLRVALGLPAPDRPPVPRNEIDEEFRGRGTV